MFSSMSARSAVVAGCVMCLATCLLVIGCDVTNIECVNLSCCIR